MAEPVAPEKRAEVISLHAEGHGRNEIARRSGVSPAGVTRICQRAGLSFTREDSALAVRARQVDLAEARQLLVQKMMTVASDLLDSVDQPYLVYNFGGKDNEYNEHLLDQPPIEAQRSMVVTAGIAFDKATRVLERSNGGLEDAVGILDKLASGFTAAADKYRDEMPDESE